MAKCCRTCASNSRIGISLWQNSQRRYPSGGFPAVSVVGPASRPHRAQRAGRPEPAAGGSSRPPHRQVWSCFITPGSIRQVCRPDQHRPGRFAYPKDAEDHGGSCVPNPFPPRHTRRGIFSAPTPFTPRVTHAVLPSPRARKAPGATADTHAEDAPGARAQQPASGSRWRRTIGACQTAC